VNREWDWNFESDWARFIERISELWERFDSEIEIWEWLNEIKRFSVSEFLKHWREWILDQYSLTFLRERQVTFLIFCPLDLSTWPNTWHVEVFIFYEIKQSLNMWQRRNLLRCFAAFTLLPRHSPVPFRRLRSFPCCRRYDSSRKLGFGWG
jgi:hypothetical protein